MANYITDCTTDFTFSSGSSISNIAYFITNEEVAPTKATSKRAETPEEWLRRRVNEVCFREDCA